MSDDSDICSNVITLLVQIYNVYNISVPSIDLWKYKLQKSENLQSANVYPIY